MELPHIGNNCIICNKLDFLPFSCNKCNKKYCMDHRLHGCEKLNNNIMNINKTNNKTNNTKKYKCSQKVCKEKNTISQLCKKCNKYYCIKHRFHDEHKKIN